jgi:coniferyl-aldehyde dehydrogenase
MHEISTLPELEKIFGQQRLRFNHNLYPSYQQRIKDLKALKKMVLDNQQALISALNDDFGHRSVDDSLIGDILTTISGINYTIKRLKLWMKPVRKHVGPLLQPAKAEVLYQPLGVIGIIAPWNYPLFLSMGPLTAALAAGNSAMIKMSEYTPNTNRLLSELLSKIYEKDKVVIVEGGVAIATAFSALTFDHLFFTGSTAVGKLVMKSAAENLVPVTLELGGKSPAIIDENIDIKVAASRFIMGKTLNAGQTCVAPDYILCPRNKIDQLTNELQILYTKMYPKVHDNIDCTSVINQGQYSRLQDWLQEAESKGARIYSLSTDSGSNDERKMPLTLVLDGTDDMKVMKEEIFGPILPIVGYDNLAEAIEYVNARPRPLALYIYSFEKTVQQTILLKTHAGGVCINEAAFHVANDDLPFGGVGASGMGQYHGKEGFKTFSHGKSILSRGRISFADKLFPPFGTAVHKLVYKLFIR